MDSTGLSALVAVGQAAKANGVALRLGEVSPRVMKLLTLTGLDGVLTVEAVPCDDRDG
jgi:anti-sigma B factor antagonist